MSKDHYQMYSDEFSHGQGLNKLIGRMEVKAVKLQADYDTLKASHEKLKEYASHRNDCKRWVEYPTCQIYDQGEECTCGLEQALAAAEEKT